MWNISSFVQKAQELLDPTQGLNLSQSDKNPSKATLFQHQFRLPSSQHPLYEIAAELNIPPANVTQGEKTADMGWHYVGRLHLSESFICFSTTASSFLQSASTSSSSIFTGQTHGGGPSGNGFTFPLCAIRKVERLNSQNYQVCATAMSLLKSRVELIICPLSVAVCPGHHDVERIAPRVWQQGQGQG